MSEISRHTRLQKKLAGLKVSESKVYRVCRRLKQGQAVDNRHQSGRRRYVRTAAVIKRASERIRRNPQRSCRKLGAQLKLSAKSMHRIITEDLDLRPYNKRRVQGLNATQKEKR